MARSRKFSPIFTADVTFGAVSIAKTAKGAPYAKSRSTVAFPNGQVCERQVMAFDRQYESVKDLLVAGRTARLAVQHDGGTVKIVGTPRPSVRPA